jgi:dTMP kinase
MPSEKRYFGEGLPYQSLKGLKGKLIALEGPDGVGRSTHLELLQEWLEVQGYGVLTTGWTRSELMAKTIASAKQGNILDPWSYSLLYATDFADRLEHQIIPALRSGFVVLSDRYIYTAFARNVVRGCDRQWIRDVFGFAIVPDLVCYLRIDVDTLALRVIESTKGMNYWESGMDMRMGADLYDSFKKYQGLIIEESDKIAEEFGFQVVDARRPPDEIQEALRARILPVLKEGRATRIRKTAEKAAEKLAEKSVEKPAEKPAEKAAEKPSEKAAEKVAEPAPVKEPATTG